MPASVTRNEYYWINDRLVQEVNQRSSVYARWKLRRSEDDLVATIEDLGDTKKIENGPAANPFRVAHAMLREERLHADPKTHDIGIRVPDELIRQATDIVKNVVAEISRQYSLLAVEERRTGALQFELNRHGTIEHDGWQLTIILQGFVSNPKEKKTGADIGIIVDLKDGKEQISKGLWAQAKNTDAMPENPFTLKDLNEQMRDMLERTEEAYGIIYTPNGFEVFQGNNTQQSITLDEVIVDVTTCRRGDRRPEFLADTIHRDFLIELVFQNLFPARSSESEVNWKVSGF